MFPPHAQCELIGSESLAKSHLGVPKEVGGKAFVRLVGSKRLELICCLRHSFLLFWPHLEILRALKHSCFVVLYCLDSPFHLSCTTSEPLTFWILDVCAAKHPVHSLVAEHRTVLAHGRAYEFHLPRLSRNKRR